MGIEDFEYEEAQAWARERVQNGEFKELAEAATSQTVAYMALRAAVNDGSAGAIEATAEQLDAEIAGDPRGVSSELMDLLLEAGDERAVPVFKKLLTEEHVWQLKVGGNQDRVEEFVARFDPAVAREREQAAEAERERLDRARAEVRGYDESQMVDALRRLRDAYATSSADDPDVQRLEPIATAIGERLNSEGGVAEMRRVFARVDGAAGARTLEMHWSDIGDWQG